MKECFRVVLLMSGGKGGGGSARKLTYKSDPTGHFRIYSFFLSLFFPTSFRRISIRDSFSSSRRAANSGTIKKSLPLFLGKRVN